MSTLVAFGRLLDALAFAPGRNVRLTLIGEAMAALPDPDRGWALAALTGELDLVSLKPAQVRALAEERVDPHLFRLSRDYVGDLAETVALIWPAPAAPPGPAPGPAPGLAQVVETLRAASRPQALALVPDWLDRLDAGGRHALVKLATGALRVGAGARLARLALAQRFGVAVEEIEERWHALQPPYGPLFAWLEGRGEAPDAAGRPVFRPFMLAHPLEMPERLQLADWAAEWKWDGIRVMAVHQGGERRLYSRDGNPIEETFPDLAAALPPGLVLDGELLVRGHDGGPASFNHLQQRLGRKAPSAALQRRLPVFLRAYDLLFDGDEDLRARPFAERRARLEARLVPGERLDVSPLVPARDLDELARLRACPPHPAIEGLMLKRRDSPYAAGRRMGLWFKWKKDPLTADCVLMYAQRGSGKRSSFFSDFTFGAWGPDGALAPVGKAYFGFTDAELAWLDKWVRAHTVARFGPVREVEKALVLEIAFDAIHSSPRHRSGLAMRFPRIARIRADKPAAEADTLETLTALIGLAAPRARAAA